MLAMELASLNKCLFMNIFSKIKPKMTLFLSVSSIPFPFKSKFVAVCLISSLLNDTIDWHPQVLKEQSNKANLLKNKSPSCLSLPWGPSHPSRQPRSRALTLRPTEAPHFGTASTFSMYQSVFIRIESLSLSFTSPASSFRFRVDCCCWKSD